MNYRHIYYVIISHAKSEQKLGLRKKGNGEYYERHHILPKSLFPLWVNRKSNLVLLTAREHFFCHQLLTKIYPCKQMYFAVYILVNTSKNNLRITSREYSRIKENFVKEIAVINSVPLTERGWSEEAYNKLIKDASKKRKETISKRSKQKNEELKEKFSKAQKRRYLLETDEHKAKRLETWKNKDLVEHSEKIRKAQELVDKELLRHKIRLGHFKSEEAIIEYDNKKKIYNSDEAKKQRKLDGIKKSKKTISEWSDSKKQEVFNNKSKAQKIAQNNRSDLWKKHISESKKGKNNPMYGKTTHNAQKVLYIEENKIFDSINQLSIYLHIKPQDISEAINK